MIDRTGKASVGVKCHLLSLCFLFCLQPAGAAAAEQLTWREYPVLARPDESLAAAISRSSPIRENGRDFHGTTKWFVRWHFHWFDDGRGRCAMTRVETSLTGTIQIPRLQQATEAQRQQFEPYILALREHELGHFAFGREAAAQIQRALASQLPEASCALLERNANQTGERIIEQQRVREREYDASTGYGKTQGAWLP